MAIPRRPISGDVIVRPNVEACCINLVEWTIFKSIPEVRSPRYSRSKARLERGSTLQSTNAEHPRKSMKTRKSNAYHSCSVALHFSNSKPNNENNKILCHRFPWHSERKREWLIKLRRDEEPPFKLENGVDCGQDSLAFDLVTRRHDRCTTQPCCRSRDPL